MLNLVANERHRRAIQQRAMTRLAASRNSEETAQSYPSHLAELMRLDPRARAVLYSQAGALPAPMLDDVIGQVRAIDMNAVASITLPGPPPGG